MSSRFSYTHKYDDVFTKVFYLIYAMDDVRTSQETHYVTATSQKG
jgi:hypothetical protein